MSPRLGIIAVVSGSASLFAVSACDQPTPANPDVESSLAVPQAAKAAGKSTPSGPIGVKAPIVPNGNVAGELTDIVLNLGVDLDPSVPGWTLPDGESITVTLPDGFESNGLPIGNLGPGCPGFACTTGVLLQGWPQHPIGAPPPFTEVYVFSQGATPNTIVITATDDLTPATPLEPGIKQIHLIALGHVNPRPGRYMIEVTSSVGHAVSVPIHIVPRIRPSINVTSALNAGTPNTIHQSTSVGAEAPLTHAFYLWDAGGEGMIGVTVEMINAHHALMRQGDRVVGQAFIGAPSGATGHSVESVAPSTPGNAFLFGVPTGVLEVRFTAGSEAGAYHVTYQLAGGNAAHMVVEAN
jgi:hypothetical protein